MNANAAPRGGVVLCATGSAGLEDRPASGQQHAQGQEAQQSPQQGGDGGACEDRA